MFGQSFPEDLDCGNFFDNMDDLLDFPGGDIDVGLGIGDSDSFPNIWTSHHDTWPSDSVPLFSSNTNSDSSPELYVPRFEDIVKVERPQSFIEEPLVEKKEDSFSTNTDSSSSHSQFRSSSPVSVLESSSSSSHTTNTTSLVLPAKHGRPRTKRPRPTAHEKDRGNDNGCGADSRLIIRIPKQFLSDHSKMITKKKKKTKVVSSSSWSGIALETNGNNNGDSCSSEQHPVRKCMHCEVTKTPQWRLGPMGPKTLCNACGVRYKSGRLFPEYRPAASPTFSPALHSNSHKKVAEMRNKRCSNGGYRNEENGLVLNNAYIGVGVGKSQRVEKF